jgi:hypothetical protein
VSAIKVQCPNCSTVFDVVPAVRAIEVIDAHEIRSIRDDLRSQRTSIEVTFRSVEISHDCGGWR